MVYLLDNQLVGLGLKQKGDEVDLNIEVGDVVSIEWDAQAKKAMFYNLNKFKKIKIDVQL